jgi:hypothetical protein
MQTAGKLGQSPNAGATVPVWIGQMNDPNDGVNGMVFQTGSIAMPDGTNGGEIGINLTTLQAGGSVKSVEVQRWTNGNWDTVVLFDNLGAILNAVGRYAFLVHPSSTQGKYIAVSNTNMPNQSRIQVTLTDQTHTMIGEVHVESTW